jgi:hypothetical protein
MNDKDDNLMAQADKLATAVRPERDLWPEIEQAISRPAATERTAWNTVWAKAAAIVLLVGGSSGVTYLTMSTDNDPTVPRVADIQPLVFQQATASFGSHYNLGPDYMDARRALSDNLDTRLETLSPEANATVRENIQTIREAIDEINKALAEDPDNVLLQELLIDTYRDELSVMKQVDGISNATMYRGDI